MWLFVFEWFLFHCVCVCVAVSVLSFPWPLLSSFFWSVSRWSRSRVFAEAVLPQVVSGTTALQRGTTAVRRGQGEFLLPHTLSLCPLIHLPLSPASPRRGRAPADLHLRGIPLCFLRWSRSPPRSLAMDAGIAPVPSLPLSCFQFLLLRGNGGCISRFLAKSRLE